MNFKPKTVDYGSTEPRFLRDAKNLEWTVGNITLDSSKLEEGQVVESGTAVFKNEDTNLFELVDDSTPENMVAPVLTVDTVVITDTSVDEHTSALRKASVYEELLNGVTDNFKKATQGRIVYDI